MSKRTCRREYLAKLSSEDELGAREVWPAFVPIEQIGPDHVLTLPFSVLREVQDPLENLSQNHRFV